MQARVTHIPTLKHSQPRLIRALRTPVIGLNRILGIYTLDITNCGWVL
jgi:hypothetical protein